MMSKSYQHFVNNFSKDVNNFHENVDNLRYSWKQTASFPYIIHLI